MFIEHVGDRDGLIRDPGKLRFTVKLAFDVITAYDAPFFLILQFVPAHRHLAVDAVGHQPLRFCEGFFCSMGDGNC